MSRIAAAFARIDAETSTSATVLAANTKQRAVDALAKAIRESGRTSKDLADELHIGKSQFSRLVNGDGDVLLFVDRLPVEIRDKFDTYFSASVDPFEQAMDQLQIAEQMDRIALLWLRLRGVSPKSARVKG